MASGRLLGKFFPDDERFAAIEEAEMEGTIPPFSTTKPSQAKKDAARAEGALEAVTGGNRELVKALSPVAVAVAPQAVRAIPKAIKAITKTPVSPGVLAKYVGTAAAAPLSAGGLGVLAAAGLTSYFTTRYIMERFSKGGRLDAALKAYLKSRREMANALGRALTREELQALNAHYQQVVKDIQARG